jgi:hypothetical protein
MPLVGFEPIFSAGEEPRTYALDHAATGTGSSKFTIPKLAGRTAKKKLKYNK